MTRELGRFLTRVLPLLAVVFFIFGGGGQYKRAATLARNVPQYAQSYVSMQRFVAALEVTYTYEGRLPGDVAEFLRTNFEGGGRDHGQDEWGNDYQMEEEDAGFTLVSCGPNLSCGDKDDIRVKGRKVEGRRQPTGWGQD
jgi:hypothetical protein